MAYEILMTVGAERDIETIYNYIKNRFFAPDTARKQVERILDDIEKLENSPLMFPLYKRKKWKERGLRSFTTDNYIIFYNVNEDAKRVYILHVFYAGRDMTKLLP